MATPFHLELVTPERVLFSGETEEVSLRSDGGEIAFLAHHEDYVGALDITAVHIHAPSGTGSASTSGEELLVAVHGGFVEVNSQGVTILAGVAELASEIDTARAERALSAATERLAQGDTAATNADDGHDDNTVRPTSGAMVALLMPESAEAAQRRARVRLEVAGARSA